MTEQALLILNGPGVTDQRLGADGDDDLTLERIRDRCAIRCGQYGLGLDFRQAGDDEEMARWVAEDSEQFAGLIINPAGCQEPGDIDPPMLRSAISRIAHTKNPIIEVHVTNIFRDSDRPTRPLQAPEAKMGFVCGLGLHGYLLAIDAVAKRLRA